MISRVLSTPTWHGGDSPHLCAACSACTPRTETDCDLDISHLEAARGLVQSVLLPLIEVNPRMPLLQLYMIYSMVKRSLVMIGGSWCVLCSLVCPKGAIESVTTQYELHD